MAKHLCGRFGVCTLHQGHAGLCIYAVPAPELSASIRAVAEAHLAAEAALEDARRQLVIAVAMLDAETVKRKAAEAALQAFVAGQFVLVTPSAH